MSAYLTKAQEKKLLDTYKLHNMKRFHSMNAGTQTTKDCCSYLAVDDNTRETVEKSSDGIRFYSYYAHCLSWYPQARILAVYPIVADKDNYAISPTTTRQVNRFLKEHVSPRLSVNALQFGFNVSEPHKSYKICGIEVLFIDHSDTLEKCL